MPGVVEDFCELLQKELSNKETRKKVAAIMPNIVKELVIDLEEEDFTVHFTTGEKWEMSLNIVEESRDAKGKVQRQFTPSKLKF